MMEINNDVKEYRTVRDFYKNKVVFITGGTGFLGKILLAKLLNVCDVKEIVLLCRPKKGKSSHERIDEIFSGPLFLEIRKLDPHFSKRIRIMDGDVSQNNLGLMDSEIQYLIDNCQIVIHSAATVRFDSPLNQAFRINVGGTTTILKIATEMKKLECLVYVSTAYSNCPRPRILEKFYKSPIDPQDICKIASLLDRDEIPWLTEKLIDEWPNTYAFTKGIAEGLLRKFDKKLPIAIIRPSIVAATWKDPIEGWIDNLNTVTGALLGGALGIMRVVLMAENKQADIVPADIIINCLICASWKAHNDFFSSQRQNLKIYNVVSGSKNPLYWEQLIEYNLENYEEFPIKKALWINGDKMARSEIEYNFFYFLYHFFPALFVDSILEMKGSKLRLLPIIKKMKTQFTYLQYFVKNSWVFDDTNTEELKNSLTPEDEKYFNYSIQDVDWNLYFKRFINGIRVYYLKENDDDLIKAKRKRSFHKTLHRTFMFFIYSFYALVIYALLKNSNILN